MKRFVLVGIGGYGENYAKELLAHGAEHDAKIEGVVDPFAKSAPDYEALKALGVPFYDDLDAFYAERSADFATISTPIALHEPQTLAALQHGSHVMVEKPVAGGVAQALSMRKARDESGLCVGVGFQWCYEPAMLAMKRDVDAGLFGKPVLLRALVLWPRDRAYYKRGSGWAGKKYDKNGNPIFDCVASNATAHYLENMLWVAGAGYSGARIRDLRAATARANPIETFDTCAIEATLEGGGTLRYAASHAAGRDCVQNPMFEYVFEKGTIFFGGRGQSGDHVTARFSDGTARDYGSAYVDGGAMRKIWVLTDAAEGKAEIPCGIEAALSHTLVMERVFAVSPEAKRFAPDEVRLQDDMFWVPGLAARLRTFYETGEMPEWRW